MKAKILSHVRHDGKEYSEGDIVEMSKEQAARLVSLGIAIIENSIDLNSKIITTTITLTSGGKGNKDPRNPEDMNIDELKQELSIMGVLFKINDKRERLLKMYLEEKEKGNNK